MKVLLGLVGVALAGALGWHLGGWLYDRRHPAP